MSKIELDLQNLSTLDAEIKIRENRKISLQAELESLMRELSILQDKSGKEIALAKQQCENECQEKINEANGLLKEAKKKLALAEQREKDSDAINEQVRQLDIKSKSTAEAQKTADNALSIATEREHKANLLIEQYTKKLNEIGGIAKESKEDKPIKKK